jgi:hypothetical protein
MNAVRATDAHVLEAIAWMEKRSMPAIPADTFSKTGFVVEGIAGLWLYTTDSTLAYLEMLVSNPDASSADRHAALDLVIQACVNAARAAGCRGVMAPVAHPDVVRRAQENGFNVVAKDISLIAFAIGGL